MNVRVPASDWNTALKTAAALKVLPGRGLRVRRTKNGTTINLAPEDFVWRHPFQVQTRYFDDAWHFRVAPGFVNGEPPLVPSTAPEKKDEDDKPEDRNILEAGWIKAQDFLELGTELNPVPAYFERLGARNAPRINVTLGNFDSVNFGDLLEAKSGKPLVKFEIFLAKARAQLVSSPQAVDPTGATGTIFQSAPRYDLTALERNGAKPRLLQAFEMPRPSPLSDAALRILGLVPDEPEDRLLVARVYLLADKSGADAKNPDENWTAYVEQKVFWNLTHAPKNEVPKVDRPPITFFTGLAGGLGDLIINQSLALINNLSQQAVNAIDTTEVGGRYWTA